MRRTLCLFSQTKTTSTLPTVAVTIPEYHSNAGFLPPENHFISLIHAAKTTHHLRQIHAQLVFHSLSQNSHVVTQLISACSPFKSIDYAISIFQSFLDHNPFTFNALIRALSDNGRFEIALAHFALMWRVNVRPDRLTFPFALKSVAALLEIGFGGAIHAEVLRMGLQLDSFVRTSLADMYVKFGCLRNALQLFDETPERNKAGNLLLWNVVINGCSREGDLETAKELFNKMPERSTASWNSLINGFFKKGDVGNARALFIQMPEKNVVSWTTMVAGYSQNGDNDRALETFEQMLKEGVRPNDYTVVSVLSACARMGALDAGKRIHEYVSRNRFKLNTPIGTALIDMYAKCGKIDCARQIFDQLKEKDLLTWSAMILGWAMNGCSEDAIRCFEEMKTAGIAPDDVVFLAILTACSHSGLVDRGLQYFNSIRQNNSIEPTVKHYTCMVDLFGRAGRLEEALKIIENMPIQPDFVIWGALFSACKAHKNIEVAELASKLLLKLEPKHPGSYIFLSNIYAGAGRWDDVETVRVTMRNKHIDKSPGWSSIEIGAQVHSFVAGDRSHLCTEEIYGKLAEITMCAKVQGYMPDIEGVLHNVEDEEKEGAVGSHSEKLALAFGLLSSPCGETIRIVKNLRICGDCHSLMKYVSKMDQREIILRDIKRFHHFRDGTCTCGDYW